MKKTRFQPTFASLTEAELEQLAAAVQRETYDAVRERICKPRSDGGLDLNFTSNSPLVRLHDKKNRLDIINTRLSAQSPEQRKLTLADLNAFISLEKRAPEEIHEAILSATYALVTERDNTPHQLLALQRLADFPARSELREQTAAIRSERHQFARAREERAQAKAHRDAAMHTHKTALDLRKEAHKIQMDLRQFEHKIDVHTFQKQIATERLEIQKRRLDLAEKKAASTPAAHPQQDALGRLATNWKEVGERVRKQFDISPEEAARRRELHKTWKRPDPFPAPSITPPNPHDSRGELSLKGNNPWAGLTAPSPALHEHSSSPLNP